MPKLYSAKTIIKTLGKAGFSVVSQKGSHIKLKGMRKGQILHPIVPNHREIAKGTFSSILRQAKMSTEEFEKYL